MKRELRLDRRAAPCSLLVSNGMQTTLDVPYSARHDLNKLDLFLPPRDQANGACLFCVHGGGWSAGNRRQWHAVAQHFSSLGYVAVSASYRLAPDSPFPAQVEDLRLAMSWVRSRAPQYGFDPARIAAMGSSAGGHLVAMLGTIGERDPLGTALESLPTGTRPNAVVSYCPVTTLCAGPLQNGSLTECYLKLMGRPESEAAEAYRQASPVHRITGAEPPFLFIHGDADNTVPLAQSEVMCRGLRDAGVHAELAVLPGVGHGFGYGVTTDAQKKAIQLMEDFLGRVLLTGPGRNCRLPRGGEKAE